MILFDPVKPPADFAEAPVHIGAKVLEAHIVSAKRPFISDRSSAKRPFVSERTSSMRLLISSKRLFWLHYASQMVSTSVTMIGNAMLTNCWSGGLTGFTSL